MGVIIISREKSEKGRKKRRGIGMEQHACIIDRKGKRRNGHLRDVCCQIQKKQGKTQRSPEISECCAVKQKLSQRQRTVLLLNPIHSGHLLRNFHFYSCIMITVFLLNHTNNFGKTFQQYAPLAKFYFWYNNYFQRIFF